MISRGTMVILLGLNIRKLAHVEFYVILGIAFYEVFYSWYFAVLICYGYTVFSTFFLCVIMSFIIKLIKYIRCKRGKRDGI